MGIEGSPFRRQPFQVGRDTGTRVSAVASLMKPSASGATMGLSWSRVVSKAPALAAGGAIVCSLLLMHASYRTHMGQFQPAELTFWPAISAKEDKATERFPTFRRLPPSDFREISGSG